MDADEGVGGCISRDTMSLNSSRKGRTSEWSLMQQSISYVNSRTVQATSPTSNGTTNHCLVTHEWHLTRLFHVERTQRQITKDFELYVGTRDSVSGSSVSFPDLEYLSLILIPSNVSEICEFLEEWEFLLHKHKIMADILLFLLARILAVPSRQKGTQKCAGQAEKQLLTKQGDDASHQRPKTGENDPPLFPASP